MSRRQGSRHREAPPGREVDPNTMTILSVLRTYPSSEVAIVGCHAARMARDSCEYDLLVVSPDPTPPKYVRVGESYARVVFRAEGDLRNPEPELGASLAGATIIRDGSLLLASTVSGCKRRFQEYCSKAAESRLASALKALGRVDENSAANPQEADLWLTAASLDLCFSEIFASRQVPSPSHLVAQMKRLSKASGGTFSEWTEASGFRLASRASCENRLETVAVLYDFMKTTSMEMAMALRFGGYRADEAVAVVRAKAGELLGSLQTVECYSFLGFEIVRSTLDIHAMHCYSLGKEPDYSNVTGELTSGPDRLISEELVRGMGMVRRPELVRAGADSLRSAVSSLAAKM